MTSPIALRNLESKNLNEPPDLSIVIPIKDEEESILKQAREIEAVFLEMEMDWECLWIDDGSTDRSLEILRKIHLEQPRHRYVELDHNYGQSAALVVGFQNARGTLIATLDGDMQNDPRDIPTLVDHLRNHDLEMVNGVRAKRRDSFVRRLSSRIGNGFRNWMTGEDVTDVGCSLRVFYRECSNHLPVFKGMHRFLPTLVRIRGYKISEIPVNHRERKYGRTKYGIGNRLWVGLGDTLFVRWYEKRRVEPSIRSLVESSED